MRSGRSTHPPQMMLESPVQGASHLELAADVPPPLERVSLEKVEFRISRQ